MHLLQFSLNLPPNLRNILPAFQNPLFFGRNHGGIHVAGFCRNLHHRRLKINPQGGGVAGFYGHPPDNIPVLCHFFWNRHHFHGTGKGVHHFTDYAKGFPVSDKLRVLHMPDKPPLISFPDKPSVGASLKPPQFILQLPHPLRNQTQMLRLLLQFLRLDSESLHDFINGTFA